MNVCQVCMESDNNQTFSSMFDDNGKHASRFFLLTGLIITEISGAEKILICKYCSIQLELFSIWRERCRNNAKISKTSSMVAPSIHATKSEIVSTVDSFNEETMTNLVMKTFLDTYQTYVKSVVDHSMINPDEMCESIIASEDSNIPNISNENEFRTSIYLQQSRNCRICDQTFNSTTKCSYHYRIHHPLEKQYECELCQKSFKVPRAFRTHLRTHENGCTSLHSCHVQTHESEMFMKLPFTTEDKEKLVSS